MEAKPYLESLKTCMQACACDPSTYKETRLSKFLHSALLRWSQSGVRAQNLTDFYLTYLKLLKFEHNGSEMQILGSREK